MSGMLLYMKMLNIGKTQENSHKDLITASDRAVTTYKEMIENFIDKL